MDKSKQAAASLDEDEKKADAKKEAKRREDEKAEADLLNFKLCERLCACVEKPCRWKHHSVCAIATCGALVQPLSLCQSVSCVKGRRSQKKTATEAKAATDKHELEHFHQCLQLKLNMGKCSCPG